MPLVVHSCSVALESLAAAVAFAAEFADVRVDALVEFDMGTKVVDGRVGFLADWAHELKQQGIQDKYLGLSHTGKWRFSWYILYRYWQIIYGYRYMYEYKKE